MKKKRIIEFIPAMVMALASVVILLVYLLVLRERSALMISVIFVALAISLVVPLLNTLFKLNIPLSFNIMVAVFTFAAIDLASVMNFYDLVPYFDKAVHTSFGVVGGYGTFIFLLYGDGRKMKPWCFFIVLCLCVMGLAGLWEIFEYTASAIIGNDMQRWKPDLEAVGNMTVKEFFSTYNPLWDTMWDMIVAGFGVLAFCGAILIDRFCSYKMCRRIYGKLHPDGTDENK